MLSCWMLTACNTVSFGSMKPFVLGHMGRLREQGSVGERILACICSTTVSPPQLA